MRRSPLAVPALAALSLYLLVVPAAGTGRNAVSSQGLIVPQGPRSVRTSPLGTASIRIENFAAANGRLGASITAWTVDGFIGTPVRIPGSAFLVSDVGRIIAIETPDAGTLPGTLRILDLEGRDVASIEVRALADPALSPDGARLAYRTDDAVVVLDLYTLERTAYPRFAAFAAGPAGLAAGVLPAGSTSGAQAPGAAGSARVHELLIFDGASRIGAARLEERPQRVAFSADGSSVLVLSAGSLRRVAVTGGEAETIFRGREGWRLRDLSVEGDAILVGLRGIRGDGAVGALATITPEGRVTSIEEGPSRRIPCCGARPRTSRGIPWPIAPDAQHPVGNTYGEYQDYGTGGYLHPGVDAMGDPGQAVYAVREGEVKAVLTTSGQYHWRVAVADSATAGPSEGYLYAHLEQSSIAVDVGDTVVLGQYLGDLVEWPIYDFTHIHFARIEDEGVVWLGDWLTTENPHLDFDNQSDASAPVFEPATGGDLLAFCANETSTYQDPDALTGSVDIIAHVGDTIESPWICTVQEIRYTIYAVGYPQFPVVDDKLALFCDMVLDTYTGGPIDPFLVELLYKRDGTCFTQGDYDYREFYHVITNSDGNQVYEESDRWEAWDTSVLPDADYVVRVVASDVIGNASADSMVVTTANGNPAWVAPAETPRLVLHQCSPNPAPGSASITFSLPAPSWVRVCVYDPAGRLVRRVAEAGFDAGRHTLAWDGSDSRGRPVGAGAYFVRVESSEGKRTGKLVLIR